MRSRVFAVVLLWLLCSLAMGETKTVKLDKPIKSAAIDPSSGELAVLFADDDRVLLFPHLSEEAAADQHPIERAVGKGACRLVFKRFNDHAFFMALSTGDHTLYVLEPQTLTLLKQIMLPADVIALAAPFDADVPFVYYASGAHIGRVDLASMTDQGFAVETLANLSAASLTDLYSSSDGRLLYAVRAVTASPWFWPIETALDAGKLRIRELPGAGMAFISAIVADPFGDRAVFNRYRDSYAPPASTPSYEILQKMRLEHTCFMTQQPVFFDLNGEALHAYSYNTNKELASVKLDNADAAADGEPDATPEVFRRRVLKPDGVSLLCDEKNRKVLICRQSQITLVPLADMELPKEPLLGMKVRGPRPLHPDEAAALTITRASPQTQLELVSPPHGMTLHDDKLTWTPTEADLGSVTVTVRAFAGPVERNLSFVLPVERPSLQLPFRPDDIAVSDDGKIAVACSHHAGPTTFVTGFGAPLPAWLTLIDLDHQKILARRQLPKPVRTPVLLLKNHIFAAGLETDAIYRFSATDLSDEGQIFQDGRVQRITGAGDRLFVELSTRQILGYSATTFKPTGSGSAEQYSIFTAPLRTPDGWWFRGVLYDAKFEQAVNAINPEGLPSLFSIRTMPQPYFGHAMAEQPSYWGVALAGERLEHAPNNSAIGPVSGQPIGVCTLFPAVASLMKTQSGSTEHLALGFFDLATGASHGSIALRSDPVVHTYTGNRPVLKLVETPGRAVLQVDQTLYVLDLTPLKMDTLPQPARIIPGLLPQLASDGPTTFTVTTTGLQGAVDFSCSFNGHAIAIDAGKIIVDGLALYPAALETAVQFVNPRSFSADFPARGVAPAKAIEIARKEITPRYREIFGSAPNGIPVVVPIDLTAHDEDHRQAVLRVGLVMMIDSKAVEKRLTEMKTLHPPATAASTMPDRQDIADLKKENEQLKKENVELQAQVKVLKELLTPQPKGAQQK